MEFAKKISPIWFATAVLVVIVIVMMFQQRRSGYTPAAGAPISLMDLQEFSVFTPEQKTKYMQMITEYQQQNQTSSSKSFDEFITTISNIMRQVIQMPAPPPPQMPTPPPPQMPTM
jgi:hypothetical protein